MSIRYHTGMKNYALFGNPVSHSVSPQLHAAFARQCNIEINYQKILVPLDQFKDTVDHFRATGGLGANVTAPFKMHAFEYADQLTKRAKKSQSVNTFIFKNNICIGDNTDGIGLIRDLHKKNIALRDQTILILGAGGAARSILGEIIREKPRKIQIGNRTIEKIDQIINFFHSNIMRKWEQEQKWDIVINATNMNFKNDFLFHLNGHNTIFYDLNYGDRHKTFYDYATSQGATKIFDGLGLLIEQAAESFFQWFGAAPDTAHADVLVPHQTRFF